MHNLTIVGSVALDSVRTPSGEVDDVLGGSASYAGLAASLFTGVNVVGVVGDDFPTEHLELFRKRGMDLSGLETVVGGKTFRWRGYYERDLSKAITVQTALNVFSGFTPDLPETYRNSEFLLVGNIDPKLQLMVLDQVDRPKFTICDTMNFWITSRKDLLLEVFKRVHVAMLNEGEARQLCETENVAEAARQILQMGPQAVVIKKGEHGAMLFQQDGPVFIAPTYPLEEVVDPTGAGDSFAGGFMGYLTRSGDLSDAGLRKAVMVGTVVASYNVQAFSADRLRGLNIQDVLDRYHELRVMRGYGALEAHEVGGTPVRA